MAEREQPSLFEVNYSEAASTLALSALGGERKQSWQFKQGFMAYTQGLPIRTAMVRCISDHGREQFRMGWLVGMFLDLNTRDEIVMNREVEVG